MKKHLRLKNHLLTNFESLEWSAFEIKNISNLLRQPRKIAKEGILLGEFNTFSNFQSDPYDSIALLNATHLISNLKLRNNRIYGDIKFLDLPKGISARDHFETNQIKFDMRMSCENLKYTKKPTFIISKIITWDVVLKSDEDIAEQTPHVIVEKMFELDYKYAEPYYDDNYDDGREYDEPDLPF